ncbi:MAG: PAS domain S-box protein [Kiritimatiellae bacterium]|nr:PAS domain S-box protein [Kiritimatiellia bacterium]
MNNTLKDKISELERARVRLIERHNVERKEAEEHLVLSERRYRELLNFAVDGILIGTHDGIITDVNECMCGLFGLSREEVVGKFIGEMPFTPASVSERPFRFDLIHKGKTVVCERTIIRKDGSVVVVELHSKMMPDGNLQSIYHDITDRRKAEEQLKALNATLEQRVAERTAEVSIYAGQLRALTGRLLHAEETERCRISDVLHEDLQQTLAAARMMLGVVRESVKDTAAEAPLERVDRMLEASFKLTRSLVHELAVPGLREGGLPEAVHWISQQMKKKFGLAVELTTEGAVPPLCESVFICLFRAIQELLFNIVKHADTLHARVDIRQNGKGEVQVTIRDGGNGFLCEELNGTEANGGIGVGIFGIRERIGGLGGHMEITSAVGQGTAVVMTAPVRMDKGPLTTVL